MSPHSPQVDYPPQPRPIAMSRGRRWLVHGVLAVIVIGSAAAIVTNSDPWPFSSYTMYAQARRDRSTSWLRLYGLTADNGEYPLLANEYVLPFTKSRLPLALEMMQSPSERARLHAALLDCLMRYEKRRREGFHGGPSLHGIRLYRVHWTVDPWARNFEEPDQKLLVMEVLHPEEGEGVP